MSLNILVFLAFISLTGVFIALVTSLIKKIFGKKLSPVFHYYIWFIFILRLAFPFAPESSFSVYNLAYANINQAVNSNQYDFKDNGTAKNNINQNFITESPIEQIENIERTEKPLQNNQPVSDSANKPVNANQRQINIFDILLLIYLAGVLAGLAVYIYKYAKFKRTIKLLIPGDKSDYRILEYIKTSMSINKNIRLYKGCESMLIGVFKPVIVLAEGLSDSEKSAVLTHELLHYKNKDNLVHIIFAVIKNIYWFNPLIRYFINKIIDDMELLCDIKSINILNYRKDEYAMMLFKSSKNNNKTKIPAGVTGMSASGKQLIYRMKFISQFKKPGRAASFIALVIVTAIMVTSLTNPIGAFNNNNNEAGQYAQLAADEGIYDYSGKDLSANMTALEYAEVLIEAFKNINLPANSRAKLDKLTPDTITVAYSKINTPFKSTDVLTRAQLAYITDYFFQAIGVDTGTKKDMSSAEAIERVLSVVQNDVTTWGVVGIDAAGAGYYVSGYYGSNLTFMPSIIVKDVFENMMDNVKEGRSKDKLNAYFSCKDASAPDLTEQALEEIRTLYPLSETVPIYVFDPNASSREIIEILEYLNRAGLTNADIVRMNLEYNIANNAVSNRINIQEGYIDEIDNTLPDNIKSLYRQTTLDTVGDKKTQELYAQQYADKYGIKYALYYEKIQGGSKRIFTLLDNFPDFKDIKVYVLRDDLTEEEKIAAGFNGSSIPQPQLASLFVINGSSEYSDTDKITNEYFKQSIEKLYSLGILTGMPGDKFDPHGLVTWGQSAKIISAIICALVVY